jgi:hypothetical protein
MSRYFILFALASLHALASDKWSDGMEAEFVASDVFRSGTLILPIAHRVSFEGDYFGGTKTDTGYTAATWTWVKDELRLTPGFGVVFGSNSFTTSPACSVRWEYERKWFVTQGLLVQAFRETPIFGENETDYATRARRQPIGSVRPAITDGDHVSGRWRRLTVGGAWEHIAFREGDEWKGGGRVAIEIVPRVSAVLYVLGPGRTEWRGGISFEPRREK